MTNQNKNENTAPKPTQVTNRSGHEIRDALIHPYTIMMAAGLASIAFIGYKAIDQGLEQAKNGKYPDFSPDIPSKILEKEHEEGSGGGIGLYPTGMPSSPIIAYPKSGEGEQYTFKMGQKVKNGNGDLAEASTYVWVDEQTYEEHEVGEVVVPEDIAEAVKGYTWHEELPKK